MVARHTITRGTTTRYEMLSGGSDYLISVRSVIFRAAKLVGFVVEGSVLLG